MLANGWQYIQSILYLDQLKRWGTCIHLILNVLSLQGLAEDFVVLISEAKHGACEGHDHFFVVVMSSWPLIVVKMDLEDVTSQ